MSHIKERPEMDQTKIEAQAKRIMDDFLKALGGADAPKDFGLRRKGLKSQVRTAKKKECDPRFRGGFFANAPNVKNDELQMERKQW
jgi:hypothetical protein